MTKQKLHIKKIPDKCVVIIKFAWNFVVKLLIAWYIFESLEKDKKFGGYQCCKPNPQMKNRQCNAERKKKQKEKWRNIKI